MIIRHCDLCNKIMYDNDQPLSDINTKHFAIAFTKNNSMDICRTCQISEVLNRLASKETP